MDEEKKAYRVEVDVEGCEHCAAGRMWTIVGPDDYAVGTSWGDREHAQDIADFMNDAYEAGREARAVGHGQEA